LTDAAAVADCNDYSTGRFDNGDFDNCVGANDCSGVSDGPANCTAVNDYHRIHSTDSPRRDLKRGAVRYTVVAAAVADVAVVVVVVAAALGDMPKTKPARSTESLIMSYL
jgi:hypothetical protein